MLLALSHSLSLGLHRGKGTFLITYQRAKAVLGGKTCSMSHHSTKIFYRHGNRHNTFHLVVNIPFHRHHGGNILIGFVLGNPGYLLVMAGNPLQALIDRCMLIINHHIRQLYIQIPQLLTAYTDFSQPLQPQLIGIGYIGILQNMIYRKGHYIQKHFLSIQALLLLQILLHTIYQGFHKGHNSLLRHIFVMHPHHSYNIAHFIVHKNWCGTSIAIMGFPYPHFWAKYPERSLQLTSHANTAGAYLLQANPYSFNFSRSHLIERHGIAF